MTLKNKRFHALLLLLGCSPLLWLQHAGAADGRATSGVTVSVPGRGRILSVGQGDSGCTLTQGYWKNHSAYAENDSQHIPWPISEDTLLCGETWYDLLHTPPSGGNVWMRLAHQWIAARLNAASGADTSVLGDSLDDAGDLLANHCSGLSGDDADEARLLAGIFEDYNSGEIGPGHCGEEIDDCNHNGIDDSIDIAEGATDANHNGIPDACEPDITSFCEGIGDAQGGVDCPCGNVAPGGTSEGCLNGDGVGAELTATGNPSVSADTLVLHVVGIPNNHPGFFFQGEADAGHNPFGNGTRCIGGPFIRLAKIHGQPGGNSYPLPGDPGISEQYGIPAGATRYYQVLYRDAQGPCGGTTNTSNGLKVVWGL